MQLRGGADALLKPESNPCCSQSSWVGLSQVQILSARPAYFEAPFGVPRLVDLRECPRPAPDSGHKRVSSGGLRRTIAAQCSRVRGHPFAFRAAQTDASLVLDDRCSAGNPLDGLVRSPAGIADLAWEPGH